MKKTMPVFPCPLKPGDKAAITAPSSPASPAVLDSAVKSLEFLGLSPIVYESCRQHHGYLAGTDRQRADDLNAAFADPAVKGIFCLRGGFGASRILPLLNLELIKNTPKVFVGYSDITALHLVFNRLCGFVTFHGPMPNTDYRKMDGFSLSSLKRCLFEPFETSAGMTRLLSNPPGEAMAVLYPGKAAGPITGGNLSLLAGTLGSPYEPDTRGKILFLEEVGEEPYRLDKSLTALALAGKFRDCSGIVLCTFAQCVPADSQESGSTEVISPRSLELSEIFREVVLPFKKPTLLNFRAGHLYPQSTIPMGAAAKFDTSQPFIRLI